MKFLQKRAVAAVIMVLAIVASVLIGQARKPDVSDEASTTVTGSYQYVLDSQGVISEDTKAYIDAMNVSLFAQTGAQIMVVTRCSHRKSSSSTGAENRRLGTMTSMAPVLIAE